MNTPKPVLLCILDGWGHRIDHENNAIAQANTPHWDHLTHTYPSSLLEASAGDVGLPEGQMGNSEVGHMNIGAGRVVMQDLPRIDQAIAVGSLGTFPRLRQFITSMLVSNGTCHLMGLLSDGGVHSHMNHMLALSKTLCAEGIPVAIHAFLDGRDTPPQSAMDYVKTFEAELPEGAYIATVSGRYYAMDRDNRWDRVEKAYHGLLNGKGIHQAGSALEAVQASYDRGHTDEFVEPTVIGEFDGIRNGDGLFMANFRADRARQLLHALIDPAFDSFDPGTRPKLTDELGMVEYSAALAPMIDALFPPQEVNNSLGEIISEAGLKQLRIAETEKYAHVTFFFNGGSEVEYEGEDRILIPSPKVATYDLKPEMSAFEVTEALEKAIQENRYDLIVCNYANTDMVGHSGDLNAAIKAVEAVDQCVGRLAKAVLAQGGAMLITADHGNAEQMTDPKTGKPHTAHTTLPVPLVLIGDPGRTGALDLNDGKLADIAPTILRLLHLKQPTEMTGKSLIK